MDSLLILQVETTNICNANCVFCVHHKFKEFGTMSDALYEKIILEASQLPNLRKFIPMLTGEPFCDKNFIQRLKYAKEKLDVIMDVYTNGSFLTKEVIDQIKDIDKLSLNVSLNGTVPETRRVLMGLDDFNQVSESVRYLNEVGVSNKVSIINYPGVPQDELFEIYKSGNSVIPYQVWCSEQHLLKRITPYPCGRAMNYMTVRYNGDVCLCCFDPFGKVVFGNLNYQTMEEIWTSPKHRRYQEAHQQGKGPGLKLCRNCTNL